MRVKNSKDFKLYLQEMLFFFYQKWSRDMREDVLHATMCFHPFEHLKTFSSCFDLSQKRNIF